MILLLGIDLFGGGNCLSCSIECRPQFGGCCGARKRRSNCCGLAPLQIYFSIVAEDWRRTTRLASYHPMNTIKFPLSPHRSPLKETALKSNDNALHPPTHICTQRVIRIRYVRERIHSTSIRRLLSRLHPPPVYFLSHYYISLPLALHLRTGRLHNHLIAQIIIPKRCDVPRNSLSGRL